MSFRFDLDHIDRRQLVPGLILIGIGILGLFGAFGWMRGMGGLVGAVLFGAAAYFAYLQGRHTGRLLWNAAAFPLAGLAIASIAPEPLGGFAFLGSIGAAFALAWRDDARRWWAVIPAGTLFALALTALVDGTTRGAGAGGAVFLFGLAATFFVLTRLPVHPQPWAIFPAGVLAVLAVVTLTTSGGWLVPVLLIAAGAWMLFRPGAARPAAPTSASAAGPITTVQAEPVAPAAPARPAAPAAPAEPPAAPAAPVQPTAAPADPSAPPAPVDPAAPQPRDPVAPAEPTSPERPAGEGEPPR
jgi:hypothetical protein